MNLSYIHDNFYISLPHNLPPELSDKLEKAAKFHMAALGRLFNHERRGWKRDIPKLRANVAKARAQLCELWDYARAYAGELELDGITYDGKTVCGDEGKTVAY